MNGLKTKAKFREWLHRYIPAELLGTVLAAIAAAFVYSRSHSYLAAAVAGWGGEGIGFYGYFIATELLLGAKLHRQYTPLKRITLALATAGTNMLVEFLPAETIDNLFVRPFAMYVVPQHIHPYIIGFLVGKFGADLAFYAFAICGYEFKKHWPSGLARRR